jgi:hypothetical protein
LFCIDNDHDSTRIAEFPSKSARREIRCHPRKLIAPACPETHKLSATNPKVKFAAAQRDNEYGRFHAA